MKIAIHHRPGSFSDRWIQYCKKESITYIIVNAFDSDIIQQVKDCNALMWHHHHGNYKDVFAARPILFALEHAKIKVFPNFNTAWHFDDKVAQKYLLESIEAPLVPSYIFYDKNKALRWARNVSFPKVFKLKGGAGSANVKLVRSENEARKLIKKAFGKGFPQYDKLGQLKERIRKVRKGDGDTMQILKGIGRLVIPTEFGKMYGREKGYVYFQEFIPNLDSDIRLQVIGNRICGLKRFVREGDFRASGSGSFIEFDENNIDKRLLKIAFEVNSKIASQSLTIDFIYKDDMPLIVEISYGFPVNFYDNCPGYWDEKLNWHEGRFIPQEWMVEDCLQDICS